MIARLYSYLSGFTPKVWIAIGLVALLVVGVTATVIMSNNRDARMIDTAKASGAADAVIAGQNTTLDQLKDANDAEQDLRAGDERNPARYADCLRNNRRQGACERFRPLEDKLVPR